MSPRTTETYIHWIRQLILFHYKRHHLEMAEPEIAAFLNWLANVRGISANSQNVAHCAVLFLFRHVLRKEIGFVDGVVWGQRPQRLPTVFSRDEVRRILSNLSGVEWLMASILYGSGLRLTECLELRVKDLDIGRRQITVRNGKGAVDRVTPLPEALVSALHTHLVSVRRLHESDLARGGGRVEMPDALARKSPKAARSWAWQWVFPNERPSRDPVTGELRRHRLYESILQRAVKQAMRRADVSRHGSCHSLCHSFATHLLEAGYAIRTVQELL